MRRAGKPIGELGRVITGKTPPTKEREFFDGDYPFITPTDLDYDTYRVRSTLTTVTDDARRKFANQFIPEGAVTFTCIASVGKIGIATKDSLTNQQINSVIPNAQNDGTFLYYLLRYQAPRIQGLCSGVASPIINKTDFEKVKVEVPELDVQRRIASILSTYDDLIENNNRRIALLEQAARLLYEEWFVRLRFPGREHTRIVDGVPKGWRRKTLGDLCVEVREQVSPENVEPDTPYIGLEHMPRRSITLGTWGTAADVTSTKHRYRTGEVLFGKIRPYFHKVGIALNDGVTSSDAIVIRPNDDALGPLVLMTTSSDHFVKYTSQTVREGSKMPRADWKVMQQYEVKMPLGGLLDLFADIIGPLTDQLKALTYQNRSARAARDLLLPRLMSGGLMV